VEAGRKEVKEGRRGRKKAKERSEERTKGSVGKTEGRK
jgi:hypothetical protein